MDVSTNKGGCKGFPGCSKHSRSQYKLSEWSVTSDEGKRDGSTQTETKFSRIEDQRKFRNLLLLVLEILTIVRGMYDYPEGVVQMY